MYTLITGASSGLGLELARQYAEDGHDLVLVARRRERLLALAEELQARHGVTVQVLDRDLARLDAAETLHRDLADAGWPIGTLVNNAGFGTYGRLSETPLAEEEQELLLNVVTPTKLSKLYLREMTERGSGHIINMASMAAFLAGPYMAVYFASKAYLLSFTEAMAEEARGSGVRVTAVCPNVVATGFQERARNEAALVGGRIRQLMMTQERAGRLIYAGIKAGRTVVVPGMENRLSLIALRLVPRALMRRLIVPFQRGSDIR